MDSYQSDARASIGNMRGGGGGGGRMRGAPVRHAKDFRGTCKMLWHYMGNLKYWLFLVVGIANQEFRSSYATTFYIEHEPNS